ncbi:protein of unassigned function [Methylobacterium oryzae CBMB20]|uniref:Protein of unassigned function n=1 Tax=Methylobacterium oryzae CBMB20 TaxID=693986 RepID=A0A089NQ80_9HYPH|nr:protein of unassigned function [Methylobacterium oryzae CBMB20]
MGSVQNSRDDAWSLVGIARGFRKRRALSRSIGRPADPCGCHRGRPGALARDPAQALCRDDGGGRRGRTAEHGSERWLRPRSRS